MSYSWQVSPSPLTMSSPMVGVDASVHPPSDSYLLQWRNFSSTLAANLAEGFGSGENDLYSDVTLLSGSGPGGRPPRLFMAHRLVLSAGSPYFREVFAALPRSSGPHGHPVLVLRELTPEDLESVLQFVYLGRVHVTQERLASFLKIAEGLKIRGLADDKRGPAVSGGALPPATPTPSGPPTAAAAAGLLAAAAAQQPHIVAGSGNNNVPASPASSKGRRGSPDEENRPKKKKAKLSKKSVSSQNESVDEDAVSAAAAAAVGKVSSDVDITVSAGSGSQDGYDGFKAAEDAQSNGGGESMEDAVALDPVRKRCNLCHVVLLGKNMSRHFRDQHTRRSRAQCPK